VQTGEGTFLPVESGQRREKAPKEDGEARVWVSPGPGEGDAMLPGIHRTDADIQAGYRYASIAGSSTGRLPDGWMGFGRF
jgi:hypothetical protein